MRAAVKKEIKHRFVLCAAVLHNGQIYLGHNHGDIMLNIIFKDGDRVPQNQMGFVDNKGHWLSRKEAGELAYQSGQLKESTDCLLSEDLGNRLWLTKELKSNDDH